MFKVTLGLDAVPATPHNNDAVKTKVVADWTNDDGTPGHDETTVDLPATEASVVTPATMVVFGQSYIDTAGLEGPMTSAPPFAVTDTVPPDAPPGFTSITVTDQI